MYVCNFSTLTVTSNPPISKAYMCVFSSYYFTSNTPISKACVTKITVTCYLWSFGVPDAQSLLHFGINGRKYFSKIGAVIKPKPFDSMDGSYLSIYHFLVLFCFIAFYMLQNKDDSTNIKSSYHKSFHIQERRKKIGTNLYQNYYIAVKKLEMRRPFAFSFF